MASYEFNAEVETEVQIDLDITVSDEHGNEIDCDAEGYGTDVTVNIDLSDVKENLKEELWAEVRQQIIDEISDAANPMQSLAEFILLVGKGYTVNKERTDDRLKDLGAKIRAFEIVVEEKDKQLDDLRHHFVNDGLKKDEAIVLLTEQVVNLGLKQKTTIPSEETE